MHNETIRMTPKAKQALPNSSDERPGNLSFQQAPSRASSKGVKLLPERRIVEVKCDSEGRTNYYRFVTGGEQF